MGSGVALTPRVAPSRSGERAHPLSARLARGPTTAREDRALRHDRGSAARARPRRRPRALRRRRGAQGDRSRVTGFGGLAAVPVRPRPVRRSVDVLERLPRDAPTHDRSDVGHDRGPDVGAGQPAGSDPPVQLRGDAGGGDPDRRLRRAHAQERQPTRTRSRLPATRVRLPPARDRPTHPDAAQRRRRRGPRCRPGGHPDPGRARRRRGERAVPGGRRDPGGGGCRGRAGGGDRGARAASGPRRPPHRHQRARSGRPAHGRRRCGSRRSAASPRSPSSAAWKTRSASRRASSTTPTPPRSPNGHSDRVDAARATSPI